MGTQKSARKSRCREAWRGSMALVYYTWMRTSIDRAQATKRHGSREHRGGSWGWRGLLLLALMAPLAWRMLVDSVPTDSVSPMIEADEHTLMLTACQALEQERFVEARRAITLLRRLAPERPEPRLLEKLLARRQEVWAPGWARAFLEAWTELGRPDFQGSPLLPPVSVHPPRQESRHAQAWQLASTRDEVRWTLLLAIPSYTEEQVRWLLGRTSSLKDTASLVALLDPRRAQSFPELQRSMVQVALRERLAELVEESPHAMLPPLQLLLSGTEATAPLSAQELASLEAISTLARWREDSFSRTFLQVRGHLKEAGVPEAGVWAFPVAEYTVGAGVALLLRKRAEATWPVLSGEQQRWLGRMLWLVGQRMSESSTLLEYSVGTTLMELGAQHMGQECDRDEAMARDEMIRDALRNSMRAALETWPLPSLAEEMDESRARNEVQWLRALAGHAELP